MSLNAEGFRDAEWPRTKRPSVFRVLCLGDSWTFGSNVAQPAAYPAVLARLLARHWPRGDFEVLNLGMMGYSSYQGRTLLTQRGLALEPDLVVIGFAMNDLSVAGYRDKDIPATSPESDAWSKDLKKRGFRFVGSTIIYAHMQATGMVNDHIVDCFRHRECVRLAK